MVCSFPFPSFLQLSLGVRVCESCVLTCTDWLVLRMMICKGLLFPWDGGPIGNNSGGN